ncbi:amidase family protein [Meredithblackwellia eburnea MCA 4105]
MPASDLCRLSASEVVALTTSGKLLVEDYVKALIAHVEAREPTVQAWAYFDKDLIIKNAKALDALPADKRGPLHGVCVGVKDVILTKDMPTQHNSPIYKGDHPALDAACILTLRASGALIFGKTHTTEFATCQKGPVTCNPHDPTRTPGGSSSGSGAVVGDFQVPISLGTQTGGSTLRPGSYNGIYALKPTWNAISREGLKIYSLTCDTLGLYARTTADLELLAKVFRLEDDTSPAPVTLKGAKFGFTKTSVWEKAEQPIRDAYALAAKLLEAEGAIVEEVELPEEFTTLQEHYRAILAGEGRSSFLGDYLGSKDQLDPLIVSHVENSTNVSRADQLAAYDFISALRPKMDAIASKYTVLVTPSVTSEAPVTEEPFRFTGDASFQLMWSVLHTPVINVPGFKGPNGMPIGLTLVAPRYHDQALLKAAEAVGKCWEAKGGFQSAL